MCSALYKPLIVMANVICFLCNSHCLCEQLSILPYSHTIQFKTFCYQLPWHSFIFIDATFCTTGPNLLSFTPIRIIGIKLGTAIMDPKPHMQFQGLLLLCSTLLQSPACDYIHNTFFQYTPYRPFSNSCGNYMCIYPVHL